MQEKRPSTLLGPRVVPPSSGIETPVSFATLPRMASTAQKGPQKDGVSRVFTAYLFFFVVVFFFGLLLARGGPFELRASSFVRSCVLTGRPVLCVNGGSVFCFKEPK